MKFLVDAQLPMKLALHLRNIGHDVLHTLELPQANRTTDSEVLSIAHSDGRIVISKDKDFVDTFLLTAQPKQLLWVTTGNIRNDDLIDLFSSNINTIEMAFRNSNFVELSSTNIIIHQS